jgi:outer membrane protein assembly factor BamB
VVAENRLYFGVDTNDPNKGKIYCLNATTGAHIWNYTTQDKGVTVAVAYGKVYAGCGHWETSATGSVYCLDMYDGSPVWSFQTNRDITGTVSVANGKVYFSASYEGWDCVVVALNATNGNQVWSVTRYSNGAASRTAVAYGKVFVSFTYGASGVYALNETDGDEIWAFPISYGICGGPVVTDGKVFFARGYPSHTFYALNETNGAIVWTYELAGSVHSWSSAIANGRVFVADNWAVKLYAFGPPYTQQPLSASISPPSASIAVGYSVIFTSNVSGGTPPYKYQWYLDGNPVSSATSSSWTFTPVAAGTYLVYLNVTDSLQPAGDTVQSQTAQVIVAAPHPVGGFSVVAVGNTTEQPLTLYTATVAILATVVAAIKRKTHRKAKDT